MRGALSMAIASVVVFTLGTSMQATNKGSKQAASVSNAQKALLEGIQFSARLEKELASSAEPNLLRLSIKNVSKSVVLLAATYPERDYKFDVRNEKGESAPLTKAGEHLVNDTSVYRSVRLKIKPGEEIQHNVAINRLYDMSAPGTYFITIKRKVFGQEHKIFAEAVANIVKVRVVL